MLTAGFFHIVNRSPKGRRAVFRALFEFLARRSRHTNNWTQMNFGYAGDAHSGAGHTIELDGRDENERYCHQLYLRTINGCDIAGKDVVEVSSGRGGGASFIHRYLNPRTMTGVDIASSAIDFCRWIHRMPGLRFVQGDAEDLPLFDSSTDAVVNVEASFCYADLARFFAEVFRVLRPGGYFLYTDLHAPEGIEEVKARLARTGFEILETGNITANVVRALELDAERREQLIRKTVPFYLRHAMKAFAGTPGSRIPERLADGRLVYFVFTLRKPAGVPAGCIRQTSNELQAA